VRTDKNLFNDVPLKGVQEECGVFGIYKNDDFDIIGEVYNGLYALQHRGQESAGIAVNNNGDIKCVKNPGMVSEALTDKLLKTLPDGKIAIGHVRYYPLDARDVAGIQPLVMRYIKGSLAIAHNGAITNIAEIHHELEQGGAIFQSNSNAELIAYVIASKRLVTDSIEEAVLSAMDMIKGAYSLVISSPSKLIGARDQYGFRPLAIGKMNNSWMISSESCAFDSLGAEFVRDVEPGEVVVIDDEGLHSYKKHCGGKTSLCAFEHVYIARPDSIIDGVSVHKFRMNAGKALAKEHPVEADLVCGVPDSGIVSAIGYSRESGIPFGLAIIKNKYIGRTIARQQQSFNKRLVEIKINVLKASVQGKRVIIIDDSIVRGTTCAHIVKLLKEAGAKEVHMRIASPPFLNPCYYGTDIKSTDNLIARQFSAEELCQKIGADSLGYLSLEGLNNLAPCSNVGFCTACFTGEYPTEIPTQVYEDKFSKKIQK